MAVATVCPGPLAYQLGVYCGYVRFGVYGAVTAALAFALAPFLIVLAFAALYTQFAGSWGLRAIFYGVAPVIVALILKACWQLGRKTLKADVAGWGFAAVTAVMTVVLQRELASLFLGAGLLGCLWFSRGRRAPPAERPVAPPRGCCSPLAVPGCRHLRRSCSCSSSRPPSWCSAVAS